MSAGVLLNLSNMLIKVTKCERYFLYLLLSRNIFNTLNDAKAQMLYSIYYVLL